MGIAEKLLESIETKCVLYGCSDSLRQLLERYHVRRSKEYGGRLTGDASIRFFSIVKSGTELSQLDIATKIPQDWFIGWFTLMTLMGQINHLIQRPTPLCEHEITHLHQLVAALANQWKITYDGHIFPKIHVLCIDLLRFVNQHKTVSHTHFTGRVVSVVE
jgi:hypothetical protein